MDRRAFFSRGAKKIAESATKLIDKKVQTNASHWIRPPFAIDEINFLLSCTRCDECTKVCPHEVIFPLPARLGAKVVATPAMDLLNHACHLCEDWPCVQVCEPQALKIPEEQSALKSQATFSEAHIDQVLALNLPTKDNRQVNSALLAETEKVAFKAHEDIGLENQELEKQWPKIANVFINTKTCMPYNGPECGACNICPVPGAMIWDREKPIIDQDVCTGCALCRESCIMQPKAIIVQSKYKTA